MVSCVDLWRVIPEGAADALEFTFCSLSRRISAQLNFCSFPRADLNALGHLSGCKPAAHCPFGDTKYGCIEAVHCY